MGESIVISGSRPVRAVHDRAGGGGLVVACPPDPRAGGSRSDPRLRAVSTALADRGIDCLRIAYDDRSTAAMDVERALAWGADGYAQVGLCGYSFGGGIAVQVAADPPVSLAAVSAIAPAVDAADRGIAGPLQVITGTQDRVAEAVPDGLSTAATARETLPTGHGFAGYHDALGKAVARFVADAFDAPKSF